MKMDNKVKLATGAGLLAVATGLGFASYGWFKNSPETAAVTPSPITLNQTPVSTSNTATTASGVAPTNTSSSASAPTGGPFTNGTQSGIPLRAQSGTYAPVSTAPATETTTTTTTEKTAYVPASTVHQAYIRERVRNEAPGNIHVFRALKHTLAFTAKFPFRLRF
jgi:hypothetical protein